MTKYINSNELEWNQNTSGERRKNDRRTGTERREMMRFEVDKIERRNSSNDKRKTATSWGSAQPV